MILELFFISIAQGIITKSYGEDAEFKYTTSGFVCENGYTRSNTITFPDSFANVPKIIFVPMAFDYLLFSSSYLTVKLKILSVSLTNFKIQITCPSQNARTYRFSWFAIDDSRLEVINEAINDINLNPVGSKQYPIQNPNIKKAYPIIQSFGYNGGFDITLSISELTSTHVTVDINNANSHLLYLGYQVILGTDEVISFIDEITSTNDYTSQPYPIIQDSYFVISIKHMQHIGTEALKFFFKPTSTSTTISYQSLTWTGGPYPSNIVTLFWLKTSLNSEFLAMECFTIRVSKLYDRYVDLKPAFQLEFQRQIKQLIRLDQNLQFLMNLLNYQISMFFINVHQTIKRFIVSSIDAIVVLEPIRYITQTIIVMDLSIQLISMLNTKLKLIIKS